MGIFIAIVIQTAFTLLYGWFCFRLGIREWRAKFEDAAVNARIYEKRCKAAQDRITVLEAEIHILNAK